jgi:hypothetical protein
MGILTGLTWLGVHVYRNQPVDYKLVGPDLIICEDDYRNQTFYAEKVWVEEVHNDQVLYTRWEVKYPDGHVVIIKGGKCSVSQIKSGK